MIIADIYKKYSIMPNLALHQLRVAAVAKMIMEALDMQQDSVISACLLHDMGNIIKFRLCDFPEFLQPEGLDYWEQVKISTIQKYGPDEHIATYTIAKEIGVSAETLACIEAVGFSNSIKNVKASLTHRICAYADLRVGPHGLLTLRQRLEDGLKRYADRKDRPRAQMDHTALMAHYDATFAIEQSIYDIAGREITINAKEVEQTAQILTTWEVNR